MKGRSSIAWGFLVLIFLGAIVLASPWARTDGVWGNWLTSLFTACSAVCVTGLSIVDIAAEYSQFGEITLMILVEVGCLGLMTCGTFLMVAVGRRLSLASEFSLMNAYGVAQVQGLRGLIVWVVGSMLTIETAGVLALKPYTSGWYEAAFYSVMSFCNAGFGLRPGSLATFAAPAPLFIMASLTILGGIGFLVLFNLCTFKFLRRRSGGRGRLTLHTRVVLRVTGWLLLLTFLIFLSLEWNHALAAWESVSDRLCVAFYQSVTPRTCGFCVIPTEQLRPVTKLVYELLMFIGGGPGSAAAGIKVTTFAVLVYTLTAMCRGEDETVISRRTISYEIVRESIVICMALAMFVVIVTGLLFITESKTQIPSEHLFFETVSAVTTTGLSVGDTTASLSFAGKIVIMVAMFIGRLGALTVVLMIGDRESKRRVRFPSEELVVG